MSQFYNDSIFWIEVEKIKPNPYQPRQEFDDVRLQDLAESIRIYGILQPLVVTRREVTKDDGGIVVEYELVSGERRLRAARIAGLAQVPSLIRASEEDARAKLEMAIIENVQREDLNPVDRARAFQRLVEEFEFKHTEIAKKIGKSREYVTNSIRLLALPTEHLEALSQGKINEGHTRPLLMLGTRPEEQATLFREIIIKRMTVREAENIARTIAFERARKRERIVEPEVMEIENELARALGTKVQIEKRPAGGGRVVIDFFTTDDLRSIFDFMQREKGVDAGVVSENEAVLDVSTKFSERVGGVSEVEVPPVVDDRTGEEKKAAERESDEIYSVKNFSI